MGGQVGADIGDTGAEMEGEDSNKREENGEEEENEEEKEGGSKMK